jgi:very-short-patch-repair endonuclease
MHIPETLLALAAVHHGAVSRADIAAAGLSPDDLRRLLGSGRLLRISRRAFGLPGSTRSDGQDALAATYDSGPGAVLARSSAAAWFDLPGFVLRPWQTVMPRALASRRSNLATVHATRDLPARHVMVLDGVPCTTPDRTLIDLAADLGPTRLGRALDHAVARRLVRMPALFRTLDELARSGRDGIVVFRSLLEERGIDYRPGDSGLEVRFFDLVTRSGMTGFESQVNLADAEGWIGRVDFVLREACIVVEIDSDRFHASLSDRAADAERDARLRRAGWRVLRFTESQLYHRPDEILATIRAARLLGA